MIAKKPYAVVLGVNDTGYGIIRSLTVGNIPVIGFENNFSSPEIHTRLCKKIYQYHDHQHLLSLLLDFSSLLPEKPVLFITSDPLVTFCSENREMLSQYFRFHLPDYNIVTTLMEKQQFHGYAESHGFTIPRTVYYQGDTLSHNFLESLSPPYIIKPYMKSTSWKEAGLEKGIIFENAEGCSVQLPGLLAIEKNLVIQEYIPGGDDSVYFCLIYFDSNNVCQGSFCGQKVRQWPLLVGDTASAIPVYGNMQIASETIRFFSEIGYEGFGSMEFKQHRGNQKYYLIEPTVGRADHQSHIATANGINLPLIAYSLLTGSTFQTDAVNPPKDGIMWIDEPHEIVSILQTLYQKKSTLIETIHSLRRKKVYRFFNINDPIPFMFLILKFFQKLVQTLVKSVKSRFDNDYC